MNKSPYEDRVGEHALLTELYVEHFVLIDSLRLHFGRGLHVFTGETGAGKSLLLDATRVVLGGRASASVVQQAADKAVIEAVFELTEGAPALSHLNTWGIEADDGMVVATRTIYSNGRNICRLNGRTVTVQMLKTFGESLVEMQGQHESQALLTTRYQMKLLDLYGHHEELLKRTRSAYQSWREAVEAERSAQLNEADRARQIDVLRFQIDEIERINIQPGEEEALRSERKELITFERLKGHVDRLLAALENPSHGAIRQLTVAQMEARELAERVPGLVTLQEIVQTAKVNAEEAAFSLSKYATNLNSDPRRLDEIENRLAAIRSVMKKYGATVSEVLTHLERAKADLSRLEQYEDTLISLHEVTQKTLRDYIQVAQTLHDARSSQAEILEQEIQNRLYELQMKDAQFKVHVEAKENRTEDGIDHVEFLFSGNPGSELSGLHKVASGGELSRTLLALKVVLADVEQVDTLIFDEIDTGVSGEAAQRVAELLRRLGARSQVFCVTHAAQVAAAGHEHLHIVKTTEDGRANTQIHLLSDSERVIELGRLLGGSVSDATARDHAHALLESFRRESIPHS